MARPDLACRHCGGSRFHPGFEEALTSLELEMGRAFTFTSGCRCKAHNEAIKGHPRSLHVFDEPYHPGQDGTLAVDVQTLSGEFRGRLFAWAYSTGWSIGWGKGFLHLDRRDFIGLPQNTFDY